MIKWLSSPEIKILNWREFRRKISDMPVKSALQDTATLWKNCPKLQKNLFDINDVENWPDPWQLISQTAYCESSQTLGIYYTLSLTDKFTEIYVETGKTTLGLEQSRVHVQNYFIDLNAKQSVSIKADNRFILLSSLQTIIK